MKTQQNAHTRSYENKYARTAHITFRRTEAHKFRREPISATRNANSVQYFNVLCLHVCVYVLRECAGVLRTRVLFVYVYEYRVIFLLPAEVSETFRC